MVQIVVGCEADSCEDQHAVRLEYRKDARWEEEVEGSGPRKGPLSLKGLVFVFPVRDNTDGLLT